MKIENLISLCKNQNRKAQKELYDLLYNEMMRTSMIFCKDIMDAENAVIESFTSMFKNIENFRGESEFKTWFKKIVINKSITKYKNYIKKINREQQIDFNMETLDFKDNYEFIDKIEADYILRLVQELKDIERIVFTLFAIEGYSHKEISNELNFSESTSKWYYSNAKKSLQKSLIKEKLKIEYHVKF